MSCHFRVQLFEHTARLTTLFYVLPKLALAQFGLLDRCFWQLSHWQLGWGQMSSEAEHDNSHRHLCYSTHTHSKNN